MHTTGQYSAAHDHLTSKQNLVSCIHKCHDKPPLIVRVLYCCQWQSQHRCLLLHQQLNES